MIDVRNIYSMTDFLRNHKEHIARLKETKSPEVLTINGQAEVVMLDAESYEELMDIIERDAQMSAVRAALLRDRDKPREPISEEERERRMAALIELTAETERLGLYK